jgi:hypothetical protein
MAVPIDRLRFKGTHNSYCARRRRLLNDQIDDFGVWAIELDFSVPIENRSRRAIVGHDGPGLAADGEDVMGADESRTDVNDRFRLQHFLETASRAQSLTYRPLFLFLEKKGWFRTNPPPIGPPVERADDVSFDDPDLLLPLVERELLAVFPADRLFGPDTLDRWRGSHAGEYPDVPGLAGKILPIMIAPAAGTGLLFQDAPCPDTLTGPCRSLNLRDDIAIECDGLALVSDLAATNVIIRVDNHQANLSFDFAVPPNPLVIDAGSPRIVPLDGCGGEIVSTFQQGTFLRPFSTIPDALARAHGTIGTTTNPQRAGIGWTLRIRPGQYRAPLVIDMPLTIERDANVTGIVRVG